MAQSRYENEYALAVKRGQARGAVDAITRNARPHSWDVFDSNWYGFEIERVDDDGRLPDDNAASRQAMQWAAAGNRYAIEALLSILADEPQGEFNDDDDEYEQM